MTVTISAARVSRGPCGRAPVADYSAPSMTITRAGAAGGIPRDLSVGAAWRPAHWACRRSASARSNDVLTDVRRITDVCDLPLLVGLDTGFGAKRVQRRAHREGAHQVRAAGMHIEDQFGEKRCGHRPN